MKKFFANKCRWYCPDGVCGCPNKDRGRRVARIGGVDVDATWDGRCMPLAEAVDVAAGRVTPPLACDDAKIKGMRGMKQFYRNVGRGYMMFVEPVNDCWSYLFSREWSYSIEDTLYALVLLAALIPLTPFAYLCVAPIVAFIEGTREGGE